MKKHFLHLTSSSAVALFNNELSGQISDGMWENSNPKRHWEFWGDTTAVFSNKNFLETDYRSLILKTNYSFVKLIPIIGDRMLNIGRMGKVTSNDDFQYYAEYMPDTLEEFIKVKESKHNTEYWYEYVRKVPMEIAVKYYNYTTYDIKELKNDLRLISETMKNSVKIN